MFGETKTCHNGETEASWEARREMPTSVSCPCRWCLSLTRSAFNFWIASSRFDICRHANQWLVNQRIHKYIVQSIVQTANQSFNQSTNQSTNQSINQPVMQSTNKSTNQSINQLLYLSEYVSYFCKYMSYLGYDVLVLSSQRFAVRLHLDQSVFAAAQLSSQSRLHKPPRTPPQPTSYTCTAASNGLQGAVALTIGLVLTSFLLVIIAVSRQRTANNRRWFWLAQSHC